MSRIDQEFLTLAGRREKGEEDEGV